MRRRWLLWLGLGALLVALATASAIVAIESIDWAAYQAPVANAVESATGRRLTIEGQVQVELSLRPTLRANGVSFQNADWGSKPAMARCEHVAVRLRLIPLLFGRVEVGRVELRNLDVLIETDPTGLSNWKLAKSGDRGSPLALPVETMLHEVSVEGARLTFRNRDGVREIAIDHLEAGMPELGAPLDLELRGRHAEGDLRAEATLRGVAGLLAGEPIELEVSATGAGARLRAEGTLHKPLELQGLDVQVEVEGERLGSLGRLIGTPLPDRGPYRIAGHLVEADFGLRIDDLKARIGRTELEGQGGTRFEDGRRWTALGLRGPHLNLIGWLEGEANGESARDAGDLLISDVPIGLAGLRKNDFELSLRVDVVELPRIELRDVNLQASLMSGTLDIGHLAAAVGGGRAKLSGRFDASGETAALDAALEVSDVELGAFLDRVEATDLLSGGPLSGELQLSGTGRSPHEIVASLSGPVRIEIGQGHVGGDWPRLIPPERRSIVGDQTNDVELNCAVARLDFEDGVADVNRFVIDTVGLALFVGGRVDLRSETLFLAVDMARLRSVKRARTVATVVGPLAAPILGLDLTAIASKATLLAARLALLGKLPRGTSAEGPERCVRLLEARAADRG